MRSITRLYIPAVLLFVVICLTAGCAGGIRSRAVITSDPSGATVFWRGEERGDTPIEIPFIWYWYYDIRIEKEGYQPLEAMERLRARPWFVFPLDLLMEIMPFPVSDTRRLHYELQPTPPKTD